METKKILRKMTDYKLGPLYSLETVDSDLTLPKNSIEIGLNMSIELSKYPFYGAIKHTVNDGVERMQNAIQYVQGKYYTGEDVASAYTALVKRDIKEMNEFLRK